jgi:hypothetical protein
MEGGMTKFSDLKLGTIAWLGLSPTEKRIQCDFDNHHSDGGLGFFVLNGAWRGRLYSSSTLHIIDERGTRHEPVFIVEIQELPRVAPLPALGENEVPF